MRAAPCCEPPLTVGGRLRHFYDYWVTNFQLEAMVEGVLKEGYKIPFEALPQFRGIRQTPLVGEYRSRPTRGGRLFTRKRGYRTRCAGPGYGRILLHLLSRPQKDRGPEAYSQLEAHKRSDKEAVLQDGDNSVGDESLESRGLDGVIGPERRVLSHSNSSRSQAISSVLHTRPLLSVQGPALRPDDIPKDFYKSPSTCHSYLHSRGILAFPYLDDILFSAKSEVQASQSDETGQTSVQSSRLHHQREKVLHDTVTGHGFHRSKDSILEEPGVTPPREGSESGSSCQAVLWWVRPTHARKWLTLLGVMAATLAMTKHARLHMRPIQMYVLSHWNRSRQGLDYQLVVSPSSPRLHTVVDRSETPVIRFAPVPPRGTDCDHHRCILSRLGRGAGQGKPGGGEQYDGARRVATNGAGMAHKQTRTGSSSVDSEALQGPSNRSEGAGPIGQHHHMRVHQQVGRDEIPPTVLASMGPGQLVHSEQCAITCNTCARCGQCAGRFPVEAGNRPEGVGTASTCCEHVVQDLGETQHRSVCVSAQPQTDNVLLPIPVPCSDLQGRVLLELGKLLQRVCVPTNGAHTESASEGPAGPSTAHPHSTSVATQALVPGATESADSSATGASSETGSVSSVQSATSRPRRARTSGVEDQRRNLRARGFSEDVIGTMLASAS